MNEELVPNEVTRMAMEIAKDKALGIIPDDTPTFTDVDKMMEYLNKQ